jgi:hypothetical protein
MRDSRYPVLESKYRIRIRLGSQNWRSPLGNARESLGGECMLSPSAFLAMV